MPERAGKDVVLRVHDVDATYGGVIKVLEEYRVPIHCIAGTSMGALVGGAFASGMTVPEMEKITDDIGRKKQIEAWKSVVQAGAYFDAEGY